MNWLSLMSENDRAEIRKNLFGSEEFFEATKKACSKAMQDEILETVIQKEVVYDLISVARDAADYIHGQGLPDIANKIRLFADAAETSLKN